MIIRNLQTQKYLLGLSGFIVVSLTLLMLFHNPWISLLDTVTVQLNTKMLPKFITFMFNIFYSFNTGFLVFIVIFLMAFFLWGFKFKIPAAWIVFTSAAGLIFISVVNVIIPHHISELKLTYPAHAPFWITLIYSYWVIFIQPELTFLRKHWRWGLAAFWIVAWLITMLYSLFQPNTAFSDILAGWFLAVIWLEASEMLYVRYAPIAIRMPVFYNSWY